MGTHDYEDDSRNKAVLVSVNGDIVPRQEAKVSVFDAGFLLGDGVWESFRLHNGTIVFAEDHLDRLLMRGSWTFCSPLLTSTVTSLIPSTPLCSSALLYSGMMTRVGGPEITHGA